MIAVGCSWVAARAIDIEPQATTFDWDHIEDPGFVEQHSFAGQLKQKLGFDKILFLASHGSSNDEQVSKLTNFLSNSMDDYSAVYVLWGITSIYRWEMFSESTQQVQTCMLGRDPKNEELQKEIKYYFSHFWNKEYELEKLDTKIIMLDGYLKNLGVEHLFFNSFQSYNFNVSDSNFYNVKEDNNDMLSLLCRENDIKISNSSVPWLNLSRPKDTQFNTVAVKELQRTGWLDRVTAHPTVQAHELIANKLYDYIKEKNNERI